jgi:REP element-mobilizing transposase RayT
MNGRMPCAPTENTMKYNPEIHHRRSIRLKGYDYTQPGAYFVTFCSYQRDEIFGEVINGEMKLSALRKIVRNEWLRSTVIRKEIRLFDDEFIVMPNHGHGIIWIVDTTVGADGVRPNEGVRPGLQKPDAHRASLRRAPRSLGSFMAGFKASVTSRAKNELNMTGIWQRNYYDHIVRNDRELNNIRWYILNNPLNWQLDRDNAQNIRKLYPPENLEEYLKDVKDMVLKLRSAARMSNMRKASLKFAFWSVKYWKSLLTHVLHAAYSGKGRQLIGTLSI